MKKKLTLSLLSLVAIGAPVATVISCGKESPLNLSNNTQTEIRYANPVSSDGRELPSAYSNTISVPTPYAQVTAIPLPEHFETPDLAVPAGDKYKLEISLLVETYEGLLKALNEMSEMNSELVSRVIDNSEKAYKRWAENNHCTVDDKNEIRRIVTKMHKVSEELNQKNLNNFIRVDSLVTEFKDLVEKLGSTELRTKVLTELEAEYFNFFAWNSGSENIVTDNEVNELEKLVTKLREQVYKLTGVYEVRANIVKQIHEISFDISIKEISSDKYKLLIQEHKGLIESSKKLEIGSKESIKELQSILSKLKTIANIIS